MKSGESENGKEKKGWESEGANDTGALESRLMGITERNTRFEVRLRSRARLVK